MGSTQAPDPTRKATFGGSRPCSNSPRSHTVSSDTFEVGNSPLWGTRILGPERGRLPRTEWGNVRQVCRPRVGFRKSLPWVSPSSHIGRPLLAASNQRRRALSRGSFLRRPRYLYCARVSGASREPVRGPEVLRRNPQSVGSLFLHRLLLLGCVEPLFLTAQAVCVSSFRCTVS